MLSPVVADTLQSKQASHSLWTSCVLIWIKCQTDLIPIDRGLNDLKARLSLTEPLQYYQIAA